MRDFDSGPADGAAKTTRKAAPPFTIDFEDDTTPDFDGMFAAGTKAALTLPSHRKVSPTSASGKKRKIKTKDKEDRERELARERDKYLLPQDLHFSSQQLLRLFTKKLYTVSLPLGLSRVRRTDSYLHFQLRMRKQELVQTTGELESIPRLLIDLRD